MSAAEIAERCPICKTTHAPSERPHGRAIAAIERQKELARQIRTGERLPSITKHRRLDDSDRSGVGARARRWALEQVYRGVPTNGAAKAYALMLLRDPCAYCGARDDVGIDHIFPVARGGTSAWSNLSACCRACNTRKRQRNVIQALHWLIYQRLTGERLTYCAGMNQG